MHSIEDPVKLHATTRQVVSKGPGAIPDVALAGTLTHVGLPGG